MSKLSFPSFSTLVFDLDGVVWRGDTAVEGAAEAIARLRDSGRRCLFATNNSSRPPAFFAEKLERIGVAASPDDVVTSSSATAFYVARNFAPGARVFVVGEEGIAQALESVGARVFTPANPPEAVELVVAGIDRQFAYDTLRLAQRYILEGAQFLATNRDPTFPVEGGVVPGAGSIVAAIETASGTTPLSMGKPEPTMLQLILEREGATPATAAMIGDRLDTDIACARRASVAAILVLTGVTSRERGEDAEGEERPDAIFDDLGAFCDAVLTTS